MNDDGGISKQEGNVDKSGREGVVSSVENVPCSFGASSTIKALVKATYPSFKYNQRKRFRSGNHLHWNSSRSPLAGSRIGTALRKNCVKKSRLQNKTPSSWNGHSGSNDNLIISFSDGEDVDSEFENANLQIMSSVKVNEGEIDKSRRPMNSSNLESKILQRKINHQKMATIGKKTIDHPLEPLRTGTLGSSVGTAFEKPCPVHQENPAAKSIRNKEGRVADVNVTEDSLKSLREQIAKRESVIRLQRKSYDGKKDEIPLLQGSYVSKENQYLKPTVNSSETSSLLRSGNMVARHSSSKHASERSNAADEPSAEAFGQSQVKEKEALITYFADPNEPEHQQQSGLDRDDVLRLEELYDNELEEAQEYRHKCELEEMRALKAYRKAREELIAANNRCFYLYRQREVLSLMAPKWPNAAENIFNSSSGLLAEVDRLVVPEHHEYVQGSDELCIDVGAAIDSDSQRGSVECGRDFELEASLRTKLVSKLGTRSSLRSPSKGYDQDNTTVNPIEISGEGYKTSPLELLSVTRHPAPSLRLPESQYANDEISRRNRIHVGDQSAQACAGDICIDGSPSIIQPEAEISHTYCGSVVAAPISVHSLLWIVGSHLKLFPPKLKICRTNLFEVGLEDNRLISHLPAGGPGNVEFSLDPYWPLCMFELRGKCNDDECQWQHFKTQKRQKTKLSASDETHVDPHANDIRVYGFQHQLHQYTVSVPIYNVGLQIMEADPLLDQSVLACLAQQYWDVAFCASQVVPLCIRREVPSYENDQWNRPPLHFVCEADRTKNLKDGLNEPEQTLEIAIDLLNGKMSNKVLRKEVLPLLSHALETNPDSVTLWFVYLHIYYRREKSIGKDDMFSFAFSLFQVKFNPESYELWHLYICSRLTFDDRMAAYDEALSALCQKTQALAVKEEHITSCILDLSLQMINTLCMHGDINKAISRVSALVHPTADKKDSSDDLPFRDILSCLSTSDTCVLWICCLHLIIYGRLPEAVIQRLELPKDLPFAIDWLPVSAALPSERKLLAVEFLEKIAGTVQALEHSAVGDKTSAQFLAVNHVKCLSALCGGLDGSSDILTQYLRKFPTCVDLLLISFHRQMTGSAVDFCVFGEAVASWPKEVPGCQRLWNRWVELCLGHGMFKVSEKVMQDWFQSICVGLGFDQKALTSQFGNQQDAVYGLLNLSLYKLMHRDTEESRAAVDRALAIATDEEYSVCAREHAALSAGCLEQPGGDAVLRLLSGYIADSRSRSWPEPLTMKSLTTLKRPRLRQLVTCFLGRVSADSSLLNSALEALFGPGLLPEAFDEAKDLVDFVEGLMEISPSNHRLAAAACDSLSGCGRHAGFASHGLRFWAGTLLVNAVFQCSPVAPESVWLTVVNVLTQLQSQSLLDAFHKRAVAVHPFSLKLWQSYFRLSETRGNGAAVEEFARKRGISQDLKC
ncbi:zinc finger C3H1 domain protein isoform X2 [Wolffia australiana]